MKDSSSQNQHSRQLSDRRSGSHSLKQQDDDDDYHDDDKSSRVGNSFQAEIPQLIAYAPAPEYYEDEKAIKVWSPNNKIPDHVLDEFLSKAKEKFYYNTEQALGMLSWHKFDLNRAYADLPNFIPYPNEWSVEDKVLFEQAYQFHEKQFNKIKQMLPDKSMASLINYYYTWKKTRCRASLMERQSRRFALANKDPHYSDKSSNEGSSDDEADAMDTNQTNNNTVAHEQTKDIDSAVDFEPQTCCVCDDVLRTKYNEPSGIIVDGIIANFCFKCYVIWKNSGRKVTLVEEKGDCYYGPAGEERKILLAYADIKALVDGTAGDGITMLKQLDTLVQDVKRTIQTKKQKLSQINEKIQPIADQIGDLNFNEFADILPPYEITDTWSLEETQLAIQGFRRYGLDFSAISDVMRTKSPESLKIFYAKQSQQLGLDKLVEEFEKTRESSQVKSNEQVITNE